MTHPLTRRSGAGITCDVQAVTSQTFPTVTSVTSQTTDLFSAFFAFSFSDPLSGSFEKTHFYFELKRFEFETTHFNLHHLKRLTLTFILKGPLRCECCLHRHHRQQCRMHKPTLTLIAIYFDCSAWHLSFGCPPACLWCALVGFKAGMPTRDHFTYLSFKTHPDCFSWHFNPLDSGLIQRTASSAKNHYCSTINSPPSG